MPFTFSHPAIVLPLNRLNQKWISLTALVIGSLTPDFEYFIRMRVVSIYSHTSLGMLWFDLPIGLLLIILYKFADGLQLYNYGDVIMSEISGLLIGLLMVSIITPAQQSDLIPASPNSTH